MSLLCTKPLSIVVTLAPPCAHEFMIDWTPSGYELANHAALNFDGVAGVYSIEGTMTAIPSYNFGGISLRVSGFPDVTFLKFNSLVSMDGLNPLVISDNPLLINVEFNSLTTALDFAITGNASLTTILLPVFAPLAFSSYSFANNALSQAIVDAILRQFAMTISYDTFGTLSLDGGTNAAPSGAGLADAAILAGRGITVVTN